MSESLSLFLVPFSDFSYALILQVCDGRPAEPALALVALHPSRPQLLRLPPVLHGDDQADAGYCLLDDVFVIRVGELVLPLRLFQHKLPVKAC